MQAADPSSPDDAAPGAPARRPTPRQGDHPQPPSRHTPGVLALSERKRADLWKNVSILVSVLSLALAFLTIRSARSTELIHVMDPLGNMYAGPVEPLAESRGFFNVTAIYATNAALQRSPAGFDLSELLKLYYTPRALAELQDGHAQWEADIRRRNLQWKPMIDSISDPVHAAAARIVEVRGRLITAGAFANRSFYDESPFTLVLTFIRNPDAGKSGAYPWVCNDFDLKVRPVERRS